MLLKYYLTVIVLENSQDKLLLVVSDNIVISESVSEHIYMACLEFTELTYI